MNSLASPQLPQPQPPNPPPPPSPQGSHATSPPPPPKKKNNNNNNNNNNKIIDNYVTFIRYILVNLFREPVYSQCRLSGGLDSIEWRWRSTLVNIQRLVENMIMKSVKSTGFTVHIWRERNKYLSNQALLATTLRPPYFIAFAFRLFALNFYEVIVEEVEGWIN